MNGLYHIADTLDLPLTSHGAAMIGEGVRQVSLGPWNAELDIFVESDIIHPAATSVFIRFTRNLWAYLVVNEEGTQLYILNGTKAGLGGSKLPSFAGISISTTLLGLGHLKAITAKYQYASKVWTKIDVDHLEQDERK